MRRFLSLAVVMAILSALLPQTMVTVSAKPYETATGEEITIYETDFERGRHIEMSGSAVTDELSAIGGWMRIDDSSEVNGDNTIREYQGNDSTAGIDSHNRVLFVGKTGKTSGGQISGCNTRWAQYIMPSWAKHSDGIYTYTFDFYRGNRVENHWVGLANSIARNDSAEHELSLKESLGCSTQLAWYKIKIVINLDDHTSDWYSYDASGTQIQHKSYQGTNSSGANYSAACGNLTNGPYINFETQLSDSSSNALNQAYNYRLAAIDNLKITYKKSGVKAHTVTGNIYANDFSTQVNTNGNSDVWRVYGGWELYYGHSGIAKGKDNTTGFAPFAAPYKESKNGSDGAAYRLPDDKLYCTGVYNINFDMYVGANCSKPAIYYHTTNDSLDGEGGAKVSRDAGNVGVAKFSTITTPLPRSEWLNVDMTIDLDTRQWTWYLTKADGTIWKAWDGTWSDWQFGAVEFYNDKENPAVAAASNTDVTCPYGFVIDNFAINYYSGALIYSEDFEGDSMLNYVSDQAEAGGWDYASTAADSRIVSGGYNSGHAFAFIHADGKTVDSDAKVGSSDFYIPTVHIHENGYYSVTFNLYVGNDEDALSVYLNDKSYWDGKTIDMAFRKNTDGEGNKHLDKGKWYKMKININLKTGAISSYAIDPATGATKANNGETYDKGSGTAVRHRLQSIIFRGEKNSTGTISTGGGSKIDNLQIFYFGEGSNQKELGTDFDGMELRNIHNYNNTNVYGGSDWDLHNRVGDGANHMVAGGVNGSAYALSPVFAVGETLSKAGQKNSSEYWVDGDLIAPRGQWRIQHWFKICSTNDNTERFDINDADDYDEDTQETIYTFTNSNIEKGEWYHFDAVLDLDIHRKTIRVTDSKGNVVDEVNGTISKDKLTYISWYSTAGAKKTYAADDCFLIDSIGVTYNDASVDDYLRVDGTSGITFNDTNSNLMFRSRVFNNLFIEDAANHKEYKSFLGVYDASGNLVYFHPGDYRDCPTNDYWTTDADGNDVSVPYSALPGGSPDGLTFRKFLWGWDSTAGATTGQVLGETVEVTK